MPIPLVNSVASWFLKKRIHQIDLFLKYPYEVQNELLTNLLDLSKSTEFGRQYDFKSMQSYREFVNRVPISTYEDYHEKIERSRQGEDNIFWPKPIKWFAKSSGTTNTKSKFIPVARQHLKIVIMQREKIYYACTLTTILIPSCLVGKTSVWAAVKNYTKKMVLYLAIYLLF